MKVLIAPDSFKGCLSASDNAHSIEKGLLKAAPCVNTVKMPLSDGGEGLVDALTASTGGKVLKQKVTGPLGGAVTAYWGKSGDGSTGIIEMAAASGLPLVPPEKRYPALTTTYGTGELIKAALEEGCQKLIIGIGGSATNDGGCGMAQALGVNLLDEEGKELGFGGRELSRLSTIDVSGLDPRIPDQEILVACDVDNSLTGPQGAAPVYAPQKGANPALVQELDANLGHFARILARDLEIEVEEVPGAGAAGGLGAGLMAFLGGKLTSGVELVMEQAGIDEELADSHLVFTGEGELDAQSIHGKVPVGVARRAVKHLVPVIALAGGTDEHLEELHQEGLTACFSIINRPMDLEEAMAKTSSLLETSAEQVMRLWNASSHR